jgi:hypothetical protein
MKKPKFPKQLFVRVEPTQDEGEFYIAEPDPDGADDGDHVAVYELRLVKRKRITHELV